jgi:hypothetical protein
VAARNKSHFHFPAFEAGETSLPGVPVSAPLSFCAASHEKNILKQVGCGTVRSEKPSTEQRISQFAIATIQFRITTRPCAESMLMTDHPNPAPETKLPVRAAQVILVSSAMFTFISYWRTAAVVLCDLASTAYYIGGIVEQSIGPAAPWFILVVMLFSYAVRSVYIESCSMFVRGPGAGRLVHLAKHHNHVRKHSGFFHVMVTLLPFAAAFADAAKHTHASVMPDHIVNHFGE